MELHNFVHSMFIILTILETDSISRSAVLFIQQNDHITAHATCQPYSSKCGIWLSFKGFLYNPSHQQRIGWAVQSTAVFSKNKHSLECVSPTNSCQLKHNFIFDTVTLNLGNVWSPTTNEVTIPTSGLYYVSFVLVFTNGNLKATLLVNKNATTSIVKTSRKPNSYLITRERAIMLHLTEQDRLNVQIINGAVATFQQDILASFAGILVYCV